MATRKPKPAPQAHQGPAEPPVDVMDTEIPPETVKLCFELVKWVGEETEAQTISESEHCLCTSIVRVMRHKGWIADFLWEVICHQSGALQFAGRKRLTVDSVKRFADATFTEGSKADAMTAIAAA